MVLTGLHSHKERRKGQYLIWFGQRREAEVSVDDDAVARRGRRRCVEEDDGSRAQLISPPPLPLSHAVTRSSFQIRDFDLVLPVKNRVKYLELMDF